MKEKLVSQHRTSPERISVVEYGPSSEGGVKWERGRARKELGFGDEPLVAVIGRVEFRQKNHDGFLRAVHQYFGSLQGIHFLVVGEGPDLEAAQSLVSEYRLEGFVHFLPWVQDLGMVFGAIDLLLIPSRFEGVPLVMLEAMAVRVPVAASAVDGMLDYLPEESLFPPEKGRLMVETIRKTLANTNDAMLDAQQRRIREVVNAENFCRSFADVITAELEGSPALPRSSSYGTL
jgi:glycosyltransferase involved in cell wall biosynthesis